MAARKSIFNLAALFTLAVLAGFMLGAPPAMSQKFDPGPEGATLMCSGTTLTCGSTTDTEVLYRDGTAIKSKVVAPKDAKYITQTTDSTLTAEQALASLATGLVKNTTTTGVLSIATAGTEYVAGGTGVANQMATFTGAGAITGAYGLSLVERKVVSAQTTATTFTGLNGDVDRHYLLLFRANVDDGISLYYQFNGAAGTDHDWNYILYTGAAVSHGAGSGDSTGTLFAAGRSWGEANDLFGFSVINAATGKTRSCNGLYSVQGATTTNRAGGVPMGFWRDTATNLTSLEISADGADGLNTGTFSLYRIIDGT